jgi:competence protein ComEC
VDLASNAGRFDLRGAPMLLPAAALVGGAMAAFHLTWLSVPLLAVLAALAVALGRRTGACLAAGAAGMLAATLGAGLPERPPVGLAPDRPVELVARVAGHWARDDEGWTAPARAIRVRQGKRVLAGGFDLALHLPDEAEPPPPFGTALRVKGYLRRSAGFANAAPVPPGPWRMRVKSRLLVREEAPPGPVAGLSARLRGRADEAYAAAGRETPGKALARGLVLGDASAVPLAWKRGLRVAGLSHVLSVSGLHLGLLAAAVLFLGSGLPRRARLALLIPVIAIYLLLVGPLPALVRSAWMALLMVAALLAERPPAPANALAWAAVLLVIARPAVVEEPSFQLTVSATAGLVLLAPRLAGRWRRLPAWLRAPLAATVAAQLASLPWSLPRFHLLAAAAPIVNLLFVPWTGLALAGALVWTVLALAAPALAAAALPALDLLAAPFGWPAAVQPQVWLALPIVASPVAAALLAGALGLLLAGPAGRRWRALGAAGLLAGAVACGAGFIPGAASGAATGRGNPGLEIVMLDVGQGDAVLLRDGRRALLVDGGGWERGDLGGRVLLPALAALGVRRLDSLVMTHPDRDHCRGLIDIAAYLPVREVWTGPDWEASGCAGDLLTLPGPALRVLWAGEHAAAGRWRLTALHPEPGERHGEENDHSLVLLAEAEGTRVLLTGDIEEWAEHRLLSAWGERLRADVLKVAHHGSRTSSGEAFLAAVRPRLALISAGPGNPYHHPSGTVLERLAEHHIPTLRTDRHGMIRVGVAGGGRLRIDLPGFPRDVAP